MTDADFVKYENISDAIHEFLDNALKGSTPEAEEDIREKLSNEFRFWKRVSIVRTK